MVHWALFGSTNNRLEKKRALLAIKQREKREKRLWLRVATYLKVGKKEKKGEGVGVFANQMASGHVGISTKTLARFS